MNKYEKALYKRFVGQFKPINPPNKIPKTFKEFVKYFKDQIENPYNMGTMDIKYPCYNCNGSGVICISLGDVSPPQPIMDTCPVCDGKKGVSKIKFVSYYEKILKNYKENYNDYKLELQKFESLLSKLTEEEQKFLHSIIWYL